jgi:putative transposase
LPQWRSYRRSWSGSKKKQAAKLTEKRSWIEQGHPELSIRRQCELLGLNRASWYFQPAGQTAENLRLMRLIDEEYLRHPFQGSRRMTTWLAGQGHAVNRKRVQRLMRLMGLEAIYPKPRLSQPGKEARIYPYLLRNVEILRPNQVWSTDITYVPLLGGYAYLTAVLDWYSRYVLAWELSPTLDGAFCLLALDRALGQGLPEIFNTDQGVQFTSQAFTSRLESRGIAISMDSRGRALDNVFIERLWRSVKYEEVYLREYETLAALAAGLEAYFWFYCHERPHQALRNRTPAAVYALAANGASPPELIKPAPKSQHLAGSLAQQNGDSTGTHSGAVLQRLARDL